MITVFDNLGFRYLLAVRRLEVVKFCRVEKPNGIENNGAKTLICFVFLVLSEMKLYLLVWSFVTASGPPAAYPGYIPSEPSTLSSQTLWTSHNHLSSSSVNLQNDVRITHINMPSHMLLDFFILYKRLVSQMSMFWSCF